jgi:hypothetical protein
MGLNGSGARVDTRARMRCARQLGVQMQKEELWVDYRDLYSDGATPRIF